MRRADLRHPIESLERTGDRWSQWSSVPMIEMSALETYRFLRARIPPPPQRVLEVGCGNGYVTLELARDGYTVVGLDQSPDILAVAHHSREASADTPGFGTVDYVCADIRTWPIPEDRFDVVLLNRTLHHLYDFQPLLTKLHGLLVPDGLLICQEYAYDRLDKRTASWVYAMQRLLFLSGLSPDNPATTPDDISSLQAFQTAWFEKAEKREHPLNRYEEMLRALHAAFPPQYFSWVPYVFVYLGNGIRPLPQEQERAVLTFLRDMEQHLIAIEAIQASGFRYVGRAQN